MYNRFTNLITVLTVSAASSLFGSVALANPVPVNYLSTFEAIPEAFNQAYYNESGSPFEASSISSQLNFIFGWRSFPEGSFPENQMSRDAERLHQLFVEQMKLQNNQGPILRTRDLENPFNSSIRENPSEYLP